MLNIYFKPLRNNVWLYIKSYFLLIPIATVGFVILELLGVPSKYEPVANAAILLFFYVAVKRYPNMFPFYNKHLF